jgi:bifunctional DNA-binding transcriptional regulator/antitoxin component of YhaV-PrlF toxin-antitoxin module
MAVRSFSLQVAQRGLITLPQAVRKAYGIKPGQEMTLIDLDGIFVLSPRASRIDQEADKLAQELAGRGESLESMLETLGEVRAGGGQQGPEAFESEARY